MTVTARPIHPGEILREEFLEPLALSAGEVAKALEVPRTRIERIRDEHTGITADTALRLSEFFGTSPGFWLNLQKAYDLAIAREKVTLGRIARHPGMPEGPIPVSA